MKKYGVYNFVFDHEGFSAALRGLVNGGGERGLVALLSELVGVDNSTVKAWLAGSHLHNEGGITMINFIRVCNALDLDPRVFFILETTEKEGQ